MSAHVYKYSLPPGHHSDDPERLHFAGLCEGCDAVRLVGLSLEAAETRMRQGYLPDEWLNAYHHVWATSVDRFKTYGWDTPPTDSEELRRVDILRVALAQRTRA